MSRPRTALTLLAALSLSTLFAARAWAVDEFQGTRAMGMGEAGRAFAVGDSGPMLNPSGMSLVKNFQVMEGGYGYSSRLGAHTLRASMVDNTSGFGVAGGLYYNHHISEPSGRASGRGHEAGLALSLPVAGRATLGGTLKYFNLSGIDARSADGTDRHGGFTFDLGATISLLPQLSVGVVGTNLRDLHNSNATQGIGYGVAVIPRPDLVFVADGWTRFTPDNYTGRNGTSVMVGGDLTLGGKYGIRLGGGFDAATANGYGTAGVSFISEIGAIDAAIRQEVVKTGDIPVGTTAAVSLRLFIPAQQPSLQPPPGTL